MSLSDCQKALFFELLQISLGNREKLSRVPNVQEWIGLLNEAQRQTIVGILFDGLEKIPKEQLPPKEILLQWIGLAQVAEASFDLQVERVKELTRKFKDAGYKTCVLKGLSAAARYPNPKRRECGDIDFWARGNRGELMTWLRSQCKVDHVVWHHVEAKFFENVPVEVHFHPIWLYNPRHNAALQKWFAKQGQVLFYQQVNEQGFIGTSAEFDAVYQLAHCFHHLLEEGLGLRHVIDYYLVLNNLTLEARIEAFSTIQKIGLEKFATAMMWVLKEVCGMPNDELICETNDLEGKFLLDEIITGGNFGKTRQDGKSRNTLSRWWMMVKHYPDEVLFMYPWKLWHKCWRMFNN